METLPQPSRVRVHDSLIRPSSTTIVTSRLPSSSSALTLPAAAAAAAAAAASAAATATGLTHKSRAASIGSTSISALSSASSSSSSSNNTTTSSLAAFLRPQRHQSLSGPSSGSAATSRSHRSGRILDIAAADRGQAAASRSGRISGSALRVADETDAVPPSPGYTSPRRSICDTARIFPDEECEHLSDQAYKNPAHQLPSSSAPPTSARSARPEPDPADSSPPADAKMHQTSSRMLRMTDDERPFTRDFKDLFATLVVSLLPLSAHRVRLSKVENTFLSEDAISNLGSLRFSQSNRMPDPKDPSRIVTTTTTTTFSMAKDMARAICQRFLEARFIESADGKYQQTYTLKGTVWQLTPKGITVLDRFCARNGIQQNQISDLLANAITNLVLLERDSNTDKLVSEQGTIDVIFRRLVGISGKNIKPSAGAADSDSLNDYRDGMTGVKMAAERKINAKTYRDTFTGKAVTDWLMDCCTTVDRRETVEIGTLFVEYGLVEAVTKDKNYVSQYPEHDAFQPTKTAIYQIAARGRDLLNGVGGSRGRTSESECGGGGSLANGANGGGAGAGAGGAAGGNPIVRDSNTQRLDKILNDAALRLLFRENLRDTHCEENLSFHVDVEEFVRSCRSTIRAAQKNPSSTSMDAIKEIMAQAYGIYNAFLAPGSPCELNIDHQLRNNLATRMTKAVGNEATMVDTLHEVMALFEDAQNAVFKLMASDSVPKFLKSAKYEQVLQSYDLDPAQPPRGPERSQSRSNRN